MKKTIRQGGNAFLKTKKKGFRFLYTLLYLCFFFPLFATAGLYQADTIPAEATLANCIQYALQHNPDLQNAALNEKITESMIKEKLSEWYPQLSFGYNLQHNFQLPAANFNGSIIHSGSYNTSAGQLGLTQNIFNRDALLASRTAGEVRKSAIQATGEQKISLAVSVSKSFYDFILTQQQLKVIEEDIRRISRSLKDAYSQYQAGIVDKTDYKRATIALNNAGAQQKSAQEALKAKVANLKSLMGYPDSLTLRLAYDTAQMENDVYIDTSNTINFDNRVEIQQLETQKKLLQYNLQYAKWSYLPNVSAFGNYNLNFLNNEFSKLYSNAYPNSFIGLTLSLPIFQGGRRTQQIKQAQFEIAQADNSLLALQNSIRTEYENALSAYKSNLFNFLSLKENLSIANEVYQVIELQYRSGVKAYLDVITAETDLRTAQINYYNALYELLSSKLDVERALGNILY